MDPTVVSTVEELDRALMPARLANSPVSYVPTMGAMHGGHAALLQQGRRLGDALIASIFVNPTQFGPGEDIERYPRPLEDDLEMCGREGVDIVFVPEVETIHPDGAGGVTIDPGPLGAVLEGVSRPTHFRGMLTVVAKLFALVRPSTAVFGEKDYQQLALVRRMVHDLSMAIDIVGVATVRDADGLALSSRNRYLDAAQREHALALSGALSAGAARAWDGSGAVLAAAHEVLDKAEDVDLDYLALTDRDLAPDPRAGEARLLVAARIGTTRLIDNVGLVLER
ncbi:MAG: pantoate--beta-alanine ligase [Nocardioidaceae bacterium]